MIGINKDAGVFIAPGIGDHSILGKGSWLEHRGFIVGAVGFGYMV